MTEVSKQIKENKKPMTKKFTKLSRKALKTIKGGWDGCCPIWACAPLCLGVNCCPR